MSAFSAEHSGFLTPTRADAPDGLCDVAGSIFGTFTFNSSEPIAVVALRGFTNERAEFLVTTLPVAELSAPQADFLLFPLFVDGGGWATQVVLVNPTDESMEVTLKFLGQEGQTVVAESRYVIPPRSAHRVRTSGLLAAATAGSVIIEPWSTSRLPAGLCIFSFKKGGITVSEAGVGSTRPVLAQRIYVESFSQSGTVQTGVAIANPAAQNINVQFELMSLSGIPMGISASIQIPPKGQRSMFLSEVKGFQAMQTPFQGILRISTTSTFGVSVVGLRGRNNKRGDFLISTTPSVDENSLSSSGELFFPHFVDGGGYTTKFVVFSWPLTGLPRSGTILFLGQTGQPLSLSLR